MVPIISELVSCHGHVIEPQHLRSDVVYVVICHRFYSGRQATSGPALFGDMRLNRFVEGADAVDYRLFGFAGGVVR